MSKLVFGLGGVAAVVLGVLGARELSPSTDRAGAAAEASLVCTEATNNETGATMPCSVNWSKNEVMFASVYEGIMTETTFVLNRNGQTTEVKTAVVGDSRTSVSQEAADGACGREDGTYQCTASIHGQLFSLTASPKPSGPISSRVKSDVRVASQVEKSDGFYTTTNSDSTCSLRINGIPEIEGPCSLEVRNNFTTGENHFTFTFDDGNFAATVFHGNRGVARIIEETPNDGIQNIIPSRGDCEWGEIVACNVVYNGVAFELFGEPNDY